jgi:hypothetical protein
MNTATKPSILQICAIGMNELNKYILAHLPGIIASLVKVEGQPKLFLTDGSRSKKLTEAVKTPPQEQENVNGYFLTAQAYFDPSKYSFWVKFKICINGGSYDNNTAWCEYFEQSIYLCEITEQTITKVKTIDEIVKDYSVDTIYTSEQLAEQIKSFKGAKETASKLFNKIPNQVRAKTHITK